MYAILIYFASGKWSIILPFRLRDFICYKVEIMTANKEGEREREKKSILMMKSIDLNEDDTAD